MFDLADAEKQLNQQGPIQSYDNDNEYDIDDIDFDNNEFDLNNRR